MGRSMKPPRRWKRPLKLTETSFSKVLSLAELKKLTGASSQTAEFKQTDTDQKDTATWINWLTADDIRKKLINRLKISIVTQLFDKRIIWFFLYFNLTNKCFVTCLHLISAVDALILFASHWYFCLSKNYEITSQFFQLGNKMWRFPFRFNFIRLNWLKGLQWNLQHFYASSNSWKD